MKEFTILYVAIAGCFFCLHMAAVLARRLGIDKSPRDIAYELGDEEVRRQGWVAYLKAEVVLWTSMACNAIAWPLERIVALFIPAQLGAQLRLHSVMRLYAVDLVVQPVFVLVILAVPLLAGVTAPAKYLPGVLLVLYSTLAQVQLLASAHEAGADLRRSLWHPAAKAAVLALTHAALLVLGYAALENPAPWDRMALRDAASALIEQHRFLGRLADWRQERVWNLAAAASGILFMAALGRTAIAFWKLKRNDDDWIDIAKSQLFASRFEDALRSLSEIKDESRASQFHRQIAALGTGDLDGAVRHAQSYWSMKLGRTVSAADAGAMLLRLSLYPMPWRHVQTLLDQSLAGTLTGALLYSVVIRLLHREDVSLPELEALLRRHAGRDCDHRILLALFLFSAKRHPEAEQEVGACKPAGAIGRAVAAAISIREAVARESGREAQAKAFDGAAAHLDEFSRACDASTEVHDLQFLIKWSGQLAELARDLEAGTRLGAAAIHSRLEERFRLAASADAFDREVYPIGDPRRVHA